MQAAYVTLKAHHRDPSTALTHGAGSLKRGSGELNRDDDITHEFLQAPAGGAVDPYPHLNR